MFFSLKNLRALTTTEIPEPWTACRGFKVPEGLLEDKEARTLWSRKPTTEHAFLSGIAGLDPSLRVSRSDRSEGDNPPSALHAVIADYDTPLTARRREELLNEAPCPYMPTWVCDSYSKGRSRLVWEMEEPLRLAGARFTAQLMKLLRRRLALDKWLPGFDEASLKSGIYFGIGSNWRPVATERLPQRVLLGWAAEAAGKTKLFDDAGRPRPDIGMLAELVSGRFPGRWPGEFAHGAQGPRFWDPSADNERAAVVGEYGMICFTGPKAFVTWADIFGTRALDELQGKQYAPILDGFYYDGRRFWKREDDGRFLPQDKDDVRRSWNCAGFNRSRTKGEPSQLDLLEESVCSHNRVEAALPFIYMEPGILHWSGHRYLNIASARVADPAPPFGEESGSFDETGPKYFRWLHAYLSAIFAPAVRHDRGIPPGVPLEIIPRDIFLAWLQRTYRGGYDRRPQTGQALVLAGEKGVGKTFLIQGVLSPLLGGAADASEYIVSGSSFNAHLCDSPLMVVDDTTVNAREDSHRFFTAMIKRVVANSAMTYNVKHGAQAPILWRGRAIIGCNTDPESMRILPDLDSGTQDKINLFEMRRGVRLPGWDEQEEIVRRELPFLARWLLEWNPPEWIGADPDRLGRYGVRGYHHATLLDTALSSGPNSIVLEMLKEQHEGWMRDGLALENMIPGMAPLDGDAKAWVWEGRPMRLFQTLASEFPTVAGKMTADRLARSLGVLSNRGFPITQIGGGLWRVEYGPGLYAATDPDADDAVVARG
jgi:hypothetical protein